METMVLCSRASPSFEELLAVDMSGLALSPHGLSAIEEAALLQIARQGSAFEKAVALRTLVGVYLQSLTLVVQRFRPYIRGSDEPIFAAAEAALRAALVKHGHKKGSALAKITIAAMRWAVIEAILGEECNEPALN